MSGLTYRVGDLPALRDYATRPRPGTADLELLIAAAKLVITRHVRVITEANVQGHLRVGFVTASRLMCVLEDEGVIGRNGGAWECLVLRANMDTALARIRQNHREAGEGNPE